MRELDKQKREIELQYVRQLLIHHGIDSSTLECKLPPFPDTTVSLEDTLVGIEVTELMRAPDHIGESEQLLAVKAARERYIEMGGAPLNVSIRFGATTIHKSERNGVAEWIANYWLSRQPNTNTTVRWKFSDSKYGEYPNCLAGMTALRLENGIVNSWNTNLSGYVNDGFETSVTNAIEAKESKRLSSYQDQCNECWLLLVADWKRSSSFFELTSDEGKPNLPVHGFTRIYLHSVLSTRPWVQLA